MGQPRCLVTQLPHCMLLIYSSRYSKPSTNGRVEGKITSTVHGTLILRIQKKPIDFPLDQIWFPKEVITCDYFGPQMNPAAPPIFGQWQVTPGYVERAGPGVKLPKVLALGPHVLPSLSEGVL